MDLVKILNTLDFSIKNRERFTSELLKNPTKQEKLSTISQLQNLNIQKKY